MPWQHIFLRASFVLLDALHGDRGALPSPYTQGPNWVRDRCCRVLCQAGLNVNDESYRLVRTTVRCVLGSIPCQERLQPPPGQRDPVSTRRVRFRSIHEVMWDSSEGGREGWVRYVYAVLFRWASGWGRRLLNVDREFHPRRLTHPAPDLQQLMRNFHPCLLCAVQLGYRPTYACDMG